MSSIGYSESHFGVRKNHNSFSFIIQFEMVMLEMLAFFSSLLFTVERGVVRISREIILRCSDTEVVRALQGS